MKRYLRLLPVLLVSLTLVACKGKTLLKEDISGGVSPGEEAAEEVVEQEAAPGVSEAITSEDVTEEEDYSRVLPEDGSVLKPGISEPGLLTVHFEYDRFTIRESDKEVLRKNAQWLKKNPGLKIIIEGHADERGENEYNLALGEKRARSVRNYLRALGVTEDRFEIISYGEEMPVDPGHSEEAWANNRRAEFKVMESMSSR